MNYYSFAGITFSVSGIEYRYTKRRMEQYLCDAVENPDVNLLYRENDDILTPEGKTVAELEYRKYLATDDKYINYDFVKSTGKNTALMESDKFYRNVECSLNNIENIGGAAIDVRAFNMIGEVLKYAIPRHDGIILHSSALSYDDNGVLFSAKSGTGKSTHTRLWRETFADKVVMLNDDMPAIRFIDSVPYLCGTPWSGKTEINNNKQVPLKAIVFLERGIENEIFEINAAEAIFKMLNEATLPVYKELASNTMDIIEKLISGTPCYCLKCNMNPDAAITARNYIFK
ncbi:MAG: hypothetical protein IJC74_04710 [Clostridia bacterium]|nr:hypothetical protein [Clostridia bacterium]